MAEVRGDLSDEAWRLVDELIKTGKATRSDGSAFVPEDREMVGLVKWVASLKPQVRKTVSRPEDFTVGPPAVTAFNATAPPSPRVLVCPTGEGDAK